MTEPGTPNTQLHDLTPIDGGLTERRHDPATRLQEVLDAREQYRVMKWKSRFKIWGPILAVVLGGGTWAGLELKPLDAPPVLPSDLQEDVKKLEEKAVTQEKQTRALGKVVVEGFNHLGEKMDKAHPEVEPIEKPPSLVEAEKQVEKQETEAAIDRALGAVGEGG